MTEELSPEERFQILRRTDGERRWYTVDDKRLCLICERIISGREIRISGGPEKFSLGCPTDGCPGTYSHWLLYRPTPGQPAISAKDGSGEMDFLTEFGQAGTPGL